MDLADVGEDDLTAEGKAALPAHLRLFRIRWSVGAIRPLCIPLDPCVSEHGFSWSSLRACEDWRTRGPCGLAVREGIIAYWPYAR